MSSILLLKLSAKSSQRASVGPSMVFLKLVLVKREKVEKRNLGRYKYKLSTFVFVICKFVSLCCPHFLHIPRVLRVKMIRLHLTPEYKQLI